jgi:hypothetical protein
VALHHGPNEKTLYALGGGQYVDANFPKMDRIAYVDVREYGGAWGEKPGPGHEVGLYTLNAVAP